VYPASKIGSLEFVDARANREPGTAELEEVLRDALARVASAGDRYIWLVEQNLRLVGALGRGRVGVWVGVRGYVSDFSETERNPHYLASRLIWAAGYLRAVAPTDSLGVLPPPAARDVARTIQLEFVKSFPEAEEWADYIRRHGP
jgi:hypothetical protein